MRCRLIGLKSFSMMKRPASVADGVGSRRGSGASGFDCAITKVARRAFPSMTMLALIPSLLVASSVPARVTPSCMSFAEARVAFPGRHLWWHGRHAKCWDDNGRGAAVVKTRQPLPPLRPDKTPMILFPTLVEGSAPDAQLMNGASMTDGPVLLDIDVVTAESEDPPECCWPQLGEATPAATFSERWMAMPPAWVLASKR